jgi:uncharacterized protein (TIGR03382 family)
MLSRSLVMAFVLTGAHALAQDSGPDFDAALPDASVGLGGADMSQEGQDGMSNTVCALTRDCERGFTCSNGRCSYVGYRVASCQGCGGGATAAFAFPLALGWRWRRRKEARS